MTRSLHGALLRQLGFSLAVLLVEIPLGICLALSMPAQGWRSSLVLVIVALSLLIPWNVVGTIWQIYGRADIGLLGARCRRWASTTTTRAMRPTRGSRCWSWMSGTGRRWWRCCATRDCAPSPMPTTRPRASTGASKFAVFRYIQLPKMRGVLMIAVLLRFMDSFMIYTEPFVLTGGGPGNATTFLSQYLTQKAVGQFDLGPAAAFSLIYFLIILLLCFILYNWMQSLGTQDKTMEAGHG